MRMRPAGLRCAAVSRCRIAVISRRTQVVTQRSNNALGAAVTLLLLHRRIGQPFVGQCRQLVHRVQACRNTWGRPATSRNHPIKPPKRALEAPQPLGLIHAFAVCFTHRRRRSPVAIGCAVSLTRMPTGRWRYPGCAPGRRAPLCSALQPHHDTFVLHSCTLPAGC